ncbi:uncharacterized oxidoreductase [Pilibacter termitis]|uniref:Uncharacterized oxidoreductase n=1 Tax=Pilibacter termitis TaxID=263852 RepID=A0A1T4P0N4_9ENTE|nr:iron-containing alcohol dehydrogenase family protein [Pilibacter termitis]SJZ84942.1 uncharacterized oxidoreductase [Pilibacter termitis]
MAIQEAVRAGVNQYYGGLQAVHHLPEQIENYRQAVIITGKQSSKAFFDYAPEYQYLPVFYYDETCSWEDATRLSEELKRINADFIIGIGGGKIADTVKMTAHLLDIPFGFIPTLISNCAASTPLAVIYTQETHEFIEFTPFSRIAEFVLVDYTLLSKSPFDYFLAGIGDTYAKYYEARGILQATSKRTPAYAKLGFATSKVILEILNTSAEGAISALRKNEVNEEFQEVVDAIIALSGSVGGFALEYGRVAGAHAFHNALSLVKNTHSVLHGKKVAYGILVQLAVEKDFDEIKRLKKLFKHFDLPTSLQSLHLQIENRAELAKIAAFAVSEKETFRLIKPDITAEELICAIEKVEEL